MSNELAVYGADTANQQAGGGSFFDNTTMFVGSAALSGLHGIYNTFVDLGSLVGVEAERLDTARVLENYDQNWYSYYKDNKQLADIAGFIGTSFIPGTLAIKGLKAAQTAHATGAIGRSVTGSLNFFNRKRDAALVAGLEEIAQKGGSAFAYINSNKLAAMSWGAAEQVLQAAAFETGVLMTMKSSPVLADASAKDILSDMGFGMLVGGAFGGAIEALALNRVFKDAVSKVAGTQRRFDTPTAYNNLGLVAGDEAYGFVDSLLKLPKDIQFDDRFINVYDSVGKKNVVLDLESHLKRTLTKVEREAYDNIQTTLKRLGTEHTPEAGQSANNLLLKIIRDGQTQGASVDQIKQSVGNYFLGLKSWRTLTDETAEKIFQRDDLFYVNKEIDLTKLNVDGKPGTTADFIKSAFDRKPFDKNASSRPYEIVGDVNQTKLTVMAKTFQEGFDAGNDIVVIGGKVRINPKSTIYQQARDPNLIPTRFINARTGAVSDEVVSTWADMLPAGAKAADNILDDGVKSGNKFIRVADEVDPQDAYTATARFAWASRLNPKYFVERTIDVTDIALLERLKGFDKNELEGLGIKLRHGDGRITKLSSMDMITTMLSDAKLNKITRMLDDGVTDMREIAYVVNAPDEYLERVMANGFARTPEDQLFDGMSKELGQSLQRENFVATWSSPRSLVDLGVVADDTLKGAEAAAASNAAKYVDTFVTGDLGFMQRVAASDKARIDAFNAVFSEDARRFLAIDPDSVIKMADELGVGAGALSFSNANYGDMLKLWSQYTGMVTHQLIQKVANANLERLQPYIAKFTDNKKAGAELGIILNMLRRTPAKFVIAIDDAGAERLVVREATTVDKVIGAHRVDKEKLANWKKENATSGPRGTQAEAVFEIESPQVLEFLKVWRDSNAERINKRGVLMNSRGLTLGWDPAVIYAPPVDTQKFKHFALVKIKAGHIAGTSDAGMITARSAEELSTLAKEIDPDKYDVFFKKDTEQFYRVRDEYNAQLAMNEPRVDSSLRKQGKLGDFFYETRPENVLEDFITYSQHADAALVRHGVDTRYAQLITELNALGKQYTEVATSQFSGSTKLYDRASVNPFGDYVRTAMDVSKRSSFPLVNQLNELVDSAGTTAYRILTANSQKARDGVISWQEAEQIATKYGIGGVYNADNAEVAYAAANRPMDRNLIRETVSKANMFLATVGLRLDIANSLVNVISMPIMLGTELASLKSLAKSNPEAIGALSKVLGTNVDGIQVPTYTKLIGNAIHNVMGPGGKDLVASYRASGDVKDVVLQFHDMMGDLAVNPRIVPKEWKKLVDSAVEKGAKWTGNNFAEDFTRAISANVMDQMTAPLVTQKLLTSQEAAAYRSVFVNRVNGNYIASQRPILFQGTVGAAVSLFQTYIFNVMQQLTRHIENRDLRAVMTMTGLQGAIYGLNGLPFFEAVNTHLIGNANINDGHRDIYSAVTQLVGKDLGDWMLYGTASAFPLLGDRAPALYTRGDINPRHVSILPISPLDIPAVEVSRRVVANIADVGSKLVGGADISSALLEGLEHNGVSRPLAGFAQLAQGYTTTSKGSLVSSANDFDGVVTATRMLGAKPMDEAVALNTMYRMHAYKAADLDRLSRLGEVVKTKLRGGQMPDAEEMQVFMKRYASAGGNLQNYSQAIQRWTRDANTSVVNQMKMYHQSQYAQRMSEIMSGTTLDDFRTATVQEQVQ